MSLRHGHSIKAVEATIEIKITKGSSDFGARFAARMGGIADEVVLIDSGDRPVPVDGDGVVQISRRVVVVDKDGVLKLNARAWRGNSDGVDVAGEDDAEFTAQSARTSGAILDVGFAKLSVTAFWSLIPFV
jgi:hypothetical protein